MTHLTHKGGRADLIIHYIGMQSQMTKARTELYPVHDIRDPNQVDPVPAMERLHSDWNEIPEDSEPDTADTLKVLEINREVVKTIVFDEVYDDTCKLNMLLGALLGGNVGYQQLKAEYEAETK